MESVAQGWFRYSFGIETGMFRGGAAGSAGTDGIDGRTDMNQLSPTLNRWRHNVVARPVAGAGRHTMHPYFNITPESPDGKWVLFYASTEPDGHRGELRLMERATGKERPLVTGITVEDAHRVACQQWASGGKRVVFHDVRDGRWMVAAVDIDAGKQRILVQDRQLGWGQANQDWVPLYGCHWNPGEHRDLELLNVATGEIKTVVSATVVAAAYPQEIKKAFGDRPISIFFPILSPDLQRVLFKLATPAGGDFRSKQASDRIGLIGYDLSRSRFLFYHEKWGHPAWHPDGRTIIQTYNALIDSDDGSIRQIPDLPVFPGTHPSVSPDGQLFVTDTRLEPFGGAKGEWGVAVGSIHGGDYVIVHRFDQTGGATSWRRSHPHPVFSPDGQRIYFNVSAGQWTQLYVAE